MVDIRRKQVADAYQKEIDELKQVRKSIEENREVIEDTKNRVAENIEKKMDKLNDNLEKTNKMIADGYQKDIDEI